MNKLPYPKHIPIMLDEVVASLPIQDNSVLVDVTLGGGGHSKEIIKRARDNDQKITLICIDQDPNAIETFKNWLETSGFKLEDSYYSNNGIKVAVINDNFEGLRSILDTLKISEVNGIIADLGFSTDQLEDNERGFSFMREGELDMRMNPERYSVKASDLLNALYEKELKEVFKKYGDLTWEAGRLAKQVVNFREKKQIKMVSDLLEIIKSAVNFKSSRHIEARVFQAIRILINHELEALESFLPQSLESLAPQGVVSVLTFHSGEDRIVKSYFKSSIDKGEMKYLLPSSNEIKNNPKSSSAKLRIFKKNE